MRIEEGWSTALDEPVNPVFWRQVGPADSCYAIGFPDGVDALSRRPNDTRETPKRRGVEHRARARDRRVRSGRRTWQSRAGPRRSAVPLRPVKANVVLF